MLELQVRNTSRAMTGFIIAAPSLNKSVSISVKDIYWQAFAKHLGMKTSDILNLIMTAWRNSHVIRFFLSKIHHFFPLLFSSSFRFPLVFFLHFRWICIVHSFMYVQPRSQGLWSPSPSGAREKRAGRWETLGTLYIVPKPLPEVQSNVN